MVQPRFVMSQRTRETLVADAVGYFQVTIGSGAIDVAVNRAAEYAGDKIWSQLAHDWLGHNCKGFARLAALPTGVQPRRQGCTHYDVTTMASEHRSGQPRQELSAHMLKIDALPGAYVLTLSGGDTRLTSGSSTGQVYSSHSSGGGSRY
jgi:hypothetical protein